MPRADATTELSRDDARSDPTKSVRLDVSTEPEQIGYGEGAATAGDAAALRHERFRIGAKLGEGGMGVVYRAHDARDGRDVALKLMKGTLAGTARRRFEREFRSLSNLRHPNCLGVYDYGELGGSPFFTMELFLGRPITSLAGRDLHEVLDALLQLTHALDYIHGHGIVHRDVKPSNILVRPGTRPDGTAHSETRLMDFGLAKYYGVKTSLSAEAGFVGTVAYCAPEQINLDELDHRADLYCLGLVAYEILGGRYAFPDARLAGMRPLIQAHLNDKPRPLGEVNPDVPPPIADLVMKYLRKQPRRRPDSAGDLRAAISGYLGIDERSLVSGVSLVEMRPRLSVTGFVCRAREQEAIDDVLRRCLRPARGGDPEIPASLVVVSGEPGIGKSSVVQEAERIARGHGCQVYEGRCFDGNLSPFQPFVEILRQLVAEMRLHERREANGPSGDDLTATHVAGLPVQSLVRLRAIVDEYRGELLRIAPELRKYLPGEAYRQVDFGREAEYIHRALSAFFLEVASLQPICLSFEDLQWADKSSLDLLRHLAAALAESRKAGGPPEASSATPRLIIIASARVGHDQLEALMAQLRDRRQVLDIRLAPLVEAETRELIALRLNCQPDHLSDGLVARVHALCGGNPFFVAETVRDWYEKEAITRAEGGWILSSEATDTSDLPETVREVMRLRLQGLPPKVQQVVNASAVIGAVVNIDLLREVLPDLSESDVLDGIDLLIPRRVFRETGNPGQIEFVHDLLRELPYGDLSASRRQSLHRRVGEGLERRRERGLTVAPAVLADHFRNAEDRDKSFAYAMEAAEAALDVYAFNNAITHLTEARSLLPEKADNATRYNLWKMMGRACGCSGRLDEAIGSYTQALVHAENRLLRATAEHGVGENYHRKGEFDEAFLHLDAVLREVGYPRPTSLAGIAFDTWKSSLYVHCLPRRFIFPAGGSDREERLDIAFAANYLTGQMLAIRNVLGYTSCSYKIAMLAKQTGKPEHVAVAYSKFAINWGLFGMHAIGHLYIRAALRAVESRPRDITWARTLAHVGSAHYFANRLEVGESLLRESVGTLDKVGDYYATYAHHFLRHIYAIRCDIPSELAEAEAEIAIGKTHGDAESLAWGFFDKADALARAGKTDEALEFAADAVEILRSRGSMAEAKARQVLGFARMQASDYAAARGALVDASRMIRANFYLMEFMAPTFPLLVESLLGPRWAGRENGPTRVVARKAWRETRLARFVAWLFPNYRSHALRVCGRAAHALGKAKKAANYFERSIVTAEKLGARYDLARAYLDASLVIPAKSDEYRRRGQQILDELGAVVPEAERLPS